MKNEIEMSFSLIDCLNILIRYSGVPKAVRIPMCLIETRLTRSEDRTVFCIKKKKIYRNYFCFDTLREKITALKFLKHG